MLNNHQKTQLRALANNMTAIGQIGKDGLSENLLIFLDEALERHELIKIKVLKSCLISLNELTIEICRLLSCDLVQLIGRTLVFYRKNKEISGIKLVK